MTDTYVLIHGACHTGAELEPTASYLREAGHQVHCPTLAGNRPQDDRATSTLADAIASAVDYIDEYDLRDVRLLGHSYGGMVISGVVNTIPDRIRRLIYWNAFVPRSGESLLDLVPPHYKALFVEMAKSNNNAVTFPFPIFREAFINDADLVAAETAYAKLNLQPFNTFAEPISLKTELADIAVGKSYLNGLQDTALPKSHGWHPRLSERLGLFRLVECPGSHELCFTNPQLLAEKIIEAGRD